MRPHPPTGPGPRPRFKAGWACLFEPLCGLVLLLAGSDAGAARQPPWTGVVTHVTDGDTLWVQVQGASAPSKIRLHGLDAPELCQPWGPQARRLLASRVLHRTVQVQVEARDRYGRLVAEVGLGGEDLAAWMVQEGAAWAETRPRRHGAGQGRYSAVQAQAQAGRRGLWAQAETAEHPAQFRQRHGPCQTARAERALKPERAPGHTPGSSGGD